MIDVCGFHTDPDYRDELATVNAEINALTNKITGRRFHSYEDNHNTYGRLGDLQGQARTLIREAAMQDQRLDRLARAVHHAGDAVLGFIAYVTFGPTALGLEPLYEVRLLDPSGRTVPGTIRSNLPARRVQKTRIRLLTQDGPAYMRMWGRTWTSGYRAQATAF